MKELIEYRPKINTIRFGFNVSNWMMDDIIRYCHIHKTEYDKLTERIVIAEVILEKQTFI